MNLSPSPPSRALPAAADPKTRLASLRLLAAKVLLFAVVFLVSGDLGARLICSFRKAPFWSTECAWYAFYPELKSTGVEDAASTRTE